MGTISDKLMRIINTKEDIRQALISKGYDVPTSIPFKEYAKMISDLPCRVDYFPDIEGIVARYSALGLTNEQMAANPVWVDKTGNGHDLQLKNFAWKGMSGVGGYEMNFNLWTNNVSSIPDISMSTTTTSVSVSVGNSTYNNNLIYIHISNWDINKNHWLKVTSTYEDGDLAFIFYDNSNTKKIGLPANGYVNILAYPEFKGSYMYISTISNKQGSFTIEQLPLYPGALVFDGVDDYGVCDNFPILTKEKGYTVVVLRQYITRNEGPLGLVSNIENWFKDGAFLLEFREIAVSQFNRPISFGAVGKERDLPCVLTYQTSKSYNGVSIEAGNFTGTDVLHVGKLSPKLAGYCNAAIWELVFLDHDATEEELTKIKDYFVKTYPWLFFDQAWTVTGKTNEDTDRATIANITGNGNNLVLSNFGFAGNSGYGEYAYNWNKWGVSNGDATNVSKQYNKFVAVMPVNQSISTCSLYSTEVSTGTKFQFKLKITGLTTNWTVRVMERYTEGANIIYEFDKDGTYQIDHTMTGSGNQLRLYIRMYCAVPNTEGTTVTIEQIPEYEGYLVTDGVDDKIVSSSFEMGKDFTVVGEWTLLQNINVSSLRKQSSFIVRNNDLGLSLFINRISHATLIHTKSLRAFCSNGVLYKSDWTEQIDTTPQDITSSNSELLIASHYDNKSEYDKIAFKNLAIYPTVLSREDCIKAYNYLQTLKAK